MTASKLPISRSPRTASYGIVVTPPFSWPATSSTSTPSCTAKWRWVEVASVAWVMWSWACSGSCGSSHLLVPCNTVPGRSVCVDGHEFPPDVNPRHTNITNVFAVYNDTWIYIYTCICVYMYIYIYYNYTYMYMYMYMYTYTNTNMFYIVIVFFHIFSKCIPNGNTHTHTEVSCHCFIFCNARTQTICIHRHIDIHIDI